MRNFIRNRFFLTCCIEDNTAFPLFPNVRWVIWRLLLFGGEKQSVCNCSESAFLSGLLGFQGWHFQWFSAQFCFRIHDLCFRYFPWEMRALPRACSPPTDQTNLVNPLADGDGGNPWKQIGYLTMSYIHWERNQLCWWSGYGVCLQVSQIYQAPMLLNSSWKIDLKFSGRFDIYFRFGTL